MSKHLVPLALLGLASILSGGQTRTWTQSGQADFVLGPFNHLSLRRDGQLTPAPEFKERFDSSSAYLWALAQDSQGMLYTGGGPGAKLYRVTPSGQSAMIAELDALEIHAIVIDKKDQVFVATSPDGKIFKIGGAGKPAVFYDPKAKYIWALALNNAGDLFVATGDQGEIHRVTPDGKGSVFFRTEETHARSLAVDAHGNLIAGTEPGGLVLRITPAGEGFVLHQMSKKEVTALAVARDGSIYAAAVGTKQATPGLTAPPVQTVQPTLSPAPGAVAITMRPAAAPPPTFAPAGAAGVSGGSEIARIAPDGYPRRIWTHAQDVVYALAVDGSSRVLAGTGNKGVIHRLDSERLSTQLVNASPTQVTSLVAGTGGAIYAASGNPGKLFQLGPAIEKQGSIESEVFDANIFSTWGRLTVSGEGTITVAARSGNLDRPQKNWSAWSEAANARIGSPAARFLQWKATLSNGAVLREVETAYLEKNTAPRVDAIESTPANYRYPAASSTLTLTPSQNLTLPPMGKKPSSPSVSLGGDGGSNNLNPAKGYIGARWTASDDNGDPLVYTVHIRGVKELEWKLLAEKLRERHLSWDSTSFPDGDYLVRVTASDQPGNAKGEALSGQLESDPFTIDNTPPRITGLTASRGQTGLRVQWKASDALNVIEKAEYSLDGGEWTIVSPVSRVSDSKDLDYDLTLDSAGPGEHTIAVRVQDAYANQSTEKVVVSK
jgi:sugar lactone lactonase YvrE